MAKDAMQFGSWPSPVTAALVAGKAKRFGMVQTDGPVIYWTESRPDEEGRSPIMRAAPGEAAQEVLPVQFSARSKVHEYGGGEFIVADGVLFFVNQDDQDLYRVGASGEVTRLTNAPELRFADLAFDRARNRLIGVAERHVGDAAHVMPENLLVAVALDGAIGGNITPLASGRDFYASPRLSPDGSTLAWVVWDLPHMPWETAALYVADITQQGQLGDPRHVAGGNGSAVFQPMWHDTGALYFVWDLSGWGELYRMRDGELEGVTDLQAECGRPPMGVRYVVLCLSGERKSGYRGYRAGRDAPCVG